MFEVGDKVVFVGPKDGATTFGPWTIHEWGLVIGATYTVKDVISAELSESFTPFIAVEAPDGPAVWTGVYGPYSETSSTEPIYTHLFFRKVLDTSKGMETLRAMFKPKTKTKTPEHVNCRCVVSPRG